MYQKPFCATKSDQKLIFARQAGLALNCMKERLKTVFIENIRMFFAFFVIIILINHHH